MSLTFTLSASPVDRVQAELLAVPVGAGRALGPGAAAVDAALDGDLAAFMAEADFDGKPGQTLAVPTRGRLRAAAAMLVGVGAFDEITADGLRRAAAAVARKATKAASVATTLVDLADARRDRTSRRRAGRRRGFRPRLVPVPQVQGQRRRDPAVEGGCRRAGERARRSRARPRRDRGGRRHMGARHGERAVGRQVAGGVRRRGEEAAARQGRHGEGDDRGASSRPKGSAAWWASVRAPATRPGSSRRRTRRKARRGRSRSWAKAWSSTPAACRSRRRAAWRR